MLYQGKQRTLRCGAVITESRLRFRPLSTTAFQYRADRWQAVAHALDMISAREPYQNAPLPADGRGALPGKPVRWYGSRQPVFRIPAASALMERSKGRSHISASGESAPYSRRAWR